MSGDHKAAHRAARVLAAAERYRSACEAENAADERALEAYAARGPYSVPGTLDDVCAAAFAACRAATAVRAAAEHALLDAARGDL